MLIDQNGFRLDVEALRRGGEIWGNTYGQPYVNQVQNSQLTKWVPITSGLFYTTPPDLPKTPEAQAYVWRSSYGSAWVVSAPTAADGSFADVLAEYRRVQPFLLGDFYPFNYQDFSRQACVAWQANRPDLKAGMVLALRRPESPFVAVQPMLHGIDASATYDVGICTAIGPGTPQQMSGADLIKIQIPLPTMPSSTLVFYKER